MNIFIAFANQDRDVRDKLLRQMNLVKDRQGWTIWSAKEIKAGERWDDEIKHRLMHSEVVVLLLSTDFFNSTYIVETELPEVIKKHKKGDCQIIPVLARVCHWKDTAFGEYAALGDIQALPEGEKPIMSKKHWDHEDEPYFEIVEGIKTSIKAFQEKKTTQPGHQKTRAKPQERPLEPAQVKQHRKITVPTAKPDTPGFNYPMVHVEGGAFQMGSPKNEAGRSDNECQHPVTVASFAIGKYPVTQANWREIMGSDPPELYFKGCDQNPVERVSWDDVQEFLKKLNARFPGKDFRLPGEAEWEYAARGGQKSQNYVYAGSNGLKSVGWFSENAEGKTWPVGALSPNELGLYDMSGNVWEWCQDLYNAYPDCKAFYTEGRDRVLRGGSWSRYATACRAAYRDSYGAASRGGDVGFRLVSVSLQ